MSLRVSTSLSAHTKECASSPGTLLSADFAVVAQKNVARGPMSTAQSYTTITTCVIMLAAIKPFDWSVESMTRSFDKSVSTKFNLNKASSNNLIWRHVFWKLFIGRFLWCKTNEERERERAREQLRGRKFRERRGVESKGVGEGIIINSRACSG